jgi:hypothetical protein
MQWWNNPKAPTSLKEVKEKREEIMQPVQSDQQLLRINQRRFRQISQGQNCQIDHGPLKLRTVHFGDITIIYESKVSEQNIFPWLKGTIESRPHTKFQINCSFK